MELNKAYNRDELVKFLRTSFLPEDFIQEGTLLANQKQFQYTQQMTRLGECKSLELVVFEVLHSSVSDARVRLTKEAFRMLADEFCERALVFFVPQDDNSNYHFSLIEITLRQKEGTANRQSDEKTKPPFLLPSSCLIQNHYYTPEFIYKKREYTYQYWRIDVSLIYALDFLKMLWNGEII